MVTIIVSLESLETNSDGEDGDAWGLTCHDHGLSINVDGSLELVEHFHG